MTPENNQAAGASIEESAASIQIVPLQRDQHNPIENEIDLREYVAVLRRGWEWIVGFTVAAAIIAAVATAWLPPTFEADAVVVVNPSTLSAAPLLSPQAQLALMASPAVAVQVVQALGDELPAAPREPSALARQVQVKADVNDKALFRVTVQASSAQLAADLANAWADAATARVNQQQADILTGASVPLEQAQRQAQRELQAAEDKLDQLQRASQIEFLTQTISRANTALTLQASQRITATTTLAQVQSLQSLVQQGQAAVTPEMLWGLQTAASSSDPAFLIQPGQMATLTKAEQLDRLGALNAVLSAKQAALDQSVARLSQQVADLQRQLDDQTALLIEARRVRDTAKLNYAAADAQSREAQARLAAQSNSARVVSRATTPAAPGQSKLLQNIVIAAVLGLMVSVFGTFAFEYFTTPRAPQPPPIQ